MCCPAVLLRSTCDTVDFCGTSTQLCRLVVPLSLKVPSSDQTVKSGKDTFPLHMQKPLTRFELIWIVLICGMEQSRYIYIYSFHFSLHKM